MLSYIKKYPISLFIILTVIYLSFFKPPKTDLDEIPNLLQEYCTTYRGGDWLDFAANTTGAILASLIAYYVVRPRMMNKQ